MYCVFIGLSHTLTQPFLTLSPNPSSHSHPTLPHTLTQPFLTLSPNPSSHSHPTSLTLSPNPSSRSHPTLLLLFYSHSPSSFTQLDTPSNNVFLSFIGPSLSLTSCHIQSQVLHSTSLYLPLAVAPLTSPGLPQPTPMVFCSSTSWSTPLWGNPP